MRKEEWRDIEGYEGLYQISSYGQVYSIRSKKMLRPWLAGSGYQRVSLSNNGVTRDYYVHRLVGVAFIPNPDNKPTINHLDENKLNNYVENLEWATVKENINYGTHNKRARETKTKIYGKKVLCVEKGIIYNSVSEAAKAVGGYSPNISAACHGRLDTTCGYHWQIVGGDIDE